MFCFESDVDFREAQEFFLLNGSNELQDRFDEFIIPTHEVVSKAVVRLELGLRFSSCPKWIKRDLSCCMAACKKNPTNYHYVLGETRKDPELCTIVSGLNGMMLKEMPEPIRSHPVIVSNACGNKGTALQYACGDLNNNKDVVKIAIMQDPEAFTYASDELKKDESFCIEALAVDCNLITHMKMETQKIYLKYICELKKQSEKK